MPDISHELIIGAPAGLVHRALTSQEGLSAWWTPQTEIRTTSGTLRFGFGQDYYKEMKIVESKTDEKLLWRCIKGANEWIGTTLSFGLFEGDKESLLQTHPEIAGQLEQQTAGIITLLRFRHAGWKDDTAMFAECSYTWALFLHSLKLFCETGAGRPWPSQHLNRQA